MSVPGQRSNAEQSSVNVVRGLLERKLIERAVALAETRWPGSGPLVRLAHEWAHLSPGDRRQRLAAIGPEDLTRMRALAEIQPDLARVLDDLEARGILPPMPEQPSAIQPEPQPTAAPGAAATAVPTQSTIQAEAIPPPTPVDVRTGPSKEAAPEPPRRIPHEKLMPLPQVSRPTLDLGLPTTSEFLESEVERRAEMVEQAESILARVRARIDQAPDRIVERDPVTRGDRPAPLDFERMERRSSPSRKISEQEAFDAVLDDDRLPILIESIEADAATEPVRQTPLIDRFRNDPLLAIDTFEPVPTNAEISATARELGLGIIELSTESLDAREFWGGLVREGRGVMPRAGRFPSALSGHNLVVVRGRLTPRAIGRLQEGYCDIPGTKATVKVSDGARILLLPN